MEEKDPKIENDKINNNEKSVKPKRIRRTNKAIEAALFKAAKKLIEEVGFSKMTMLALSKKAKVEPPVIYNNYGDLDGFLAVFVRDFDFWLSDALVFKNPENPVENLSELLDKLVDSLWGNEFMQRLLAWEINDDNHITRRTGNARDLNSNKLIEYFNTELKQSAIPFNISSAILIGGVYYLILHRKSGTFNFIDFSREENIQKMKETIRKMIGAIFADAKKDCSPETIRIAENLARINIADSDIIQATGISEEKLLAIKTKLKEAENS